MQILSLRHSWTHLDSSPSSTPHLLPTSAPNQWCSTLLICQLYIRCSPQQQQQHAAAAAASRPGQCCGARGVAAVHRGARRQQRADRSEVVPRGRRGQRLQPAVRVAAIEVRAKRQELAEDLLGPKGGIRWIGGRANLQGKHIQCLFGAIFVHHPILGELVAS